MIFALDRVKALAPEHPEWKTKEPFASVLKGGVQGVAASGENGLLEITAVTHKNISQPSRCSGVTLIAPISI